MTLFLQTEENLRAAYELKEQGNAFFQSREVGKALQCYTRALEVTPAKHPDRATLHSNKAACFMSLREYDRVIKEAALALELRIVRKDGRAVK